MNAEEKAQLARHLIARFEEIANLPHTEFRPARRGQAPPTPTPDGRAVRAAYLAAVQSGVSVFDRAGRARAKAQAEADANQWLTTTLAENERHRAQHQATLDAQWQGLLANDPETVLPTVDAALADRRPPIAVVGLDGAAISLAVAVPSVSDVPDRMPTQTAAGNLSLARLSKTEINGWYLQWVAGHILVAAKRVFAAAPGLGTAHIVALDPSTADVVLMAASIRRESLVQLRGERANAADLLDVAAENVLLRTAGAARALVPLDILDGAELREIRTALTSRPPLPSPTTPPPTYQLQPTGPAEWVAPPRPKHRKRKIVAAAIVGILAIGWLGSLGSDEPEPRAATALMERVQITPGPFTVQSVTSTGLIRLVDPAGATVTTELTHTLLPAPTDCLGQEAIAELEALVPLGAVVTGHETGEVAVDGVLVAAELARLGLAVVDPAGATQDADYQAIEAAQDAARAAQTGLYSPTTACTLPAQLAALAAATAEASSESDAVIALAVLDQPQLDGLTVHLDDAARSHEALATLITGSTTALPLAAFTSAEVDEMRSSLAEADSLLSDTVTRTNERIESENARIQAEADAAAAAAAAAQAERDAQAAAAAAAVEPEPAALEPWNMPGPDLDCADIGKKVWISGIDYHRLDRDGDGWGCESYG